MKFFATIIFIFTLTILSLSFGADAAANTAAAQVPGTTVTTTVTTTTSSPQPVSISPLDKLPVGITSQGQQMSVRIVPDNNSARLYVVKKELSQIIAPELLQASAVRNGIEEELRLSQDGDHFTVSPTIEKPYTIRLRARVEQNEENFEITIPQSSSR